jgi:hypothetical protein
VCQFIAPSQLREGTTQPPSLESLKLYATQAERLRTIELEEKVVKLEAELQLVRTESRIQRTYIQNLKVYQAVESRFVVELKMRLREVDPRCPLLECTLPGMSRSIDHHNPLPGQEEDALALEEVYEGILAENREPTDLDVRLTDKMEVDPST